MNPNRKIESWTFKDIIHGLYKRFVEVFTLPHVFLEESW